MKERPILFSAPMVRALLAGGKTQTRRVMKRQPFISHSNPPRFSDTKPGDLFICPDHWPTDEKTCSVIVECEKFGVYHCMGQQEFAAKHSPYGQPGDHLWVRESWLYVGPGSGSDMPEYLEEQANPENHKRTNCWYAADGDRGVKWTPSIHMFRWASRILLEIVSVRVERLQAISEDDAKAEGARRFDDIPMGMPSADPCRWSMESPEDTDGCLSTARWAFANLFCKVNRKRQHDTSPWDANPWVWVVEFKRVQP